MDRDEHTLISVRGDAERIVAPDAASLSIAVSATDASKSDASSTVARALTQLMSALAELGGQPLSVATMRAPLTWSTHGIHSHEEWDHSSGNPRIAGHRSSADVAITVRNFELLDSVSRSLALQDEVDVQGVSWEVDDDNPEWAAVRADAIRAALLKSRDYAAALGGAVVTVEHVADGGLLAGDTSGQSFGRRSRTASGFVAQSAGSNDESVSLDPVPQTIRAVIEARVTATVGPLPE